MSGLNATIAIARRSSAEKPLLRVAVSLTASDVAVTRMLWPSGAAPLTDLAARLPPAPPRFSTTTVCPSRLCATHKGSRQQHAKHRGISGHGARFRQQAPAQIDAYG